MPAQCPHASAWCKSSVSVSLNGFQVLRNFAWQCDVYFWKSILCLVSQSILVCVYCVTQQCCSSSMQPTFSFTLNSTSEAPPLCAALHQQLSLQGCVWVRCTLPLGSLTDILAPEVLGYSGGYMQKWTFQTLLHVLNFSQVEGNCCQFWHFMEMNFVKFL